MIDSPGLFRDVLKRLRGCFHARTCAVGFAHAPIGIITLLVLLFGSASAFALMPRYSFAAQSSSVALFVFLETIIRGPTKLSASWSIPYVVVRIGVAINFMAKALTAYDAPGGRLSEIEGAASVAAENAWVSRRFS